MKGKRPIQLRSNVVSNDLASKGGRSISPDLPYYELLFSLAWVRVVTILIVIL
jgi:hypothetical protein